MLDISLSYGRSFRIIRGKNFSIKTKGTKKEQESISVIEKDGYYHIKQFSSEKHMNSSLEILIEVPIKINLNFSISGYYNDINLGDSKNLDVIVSGVSNVNIENVENLFLNQSGNGDILCKSAKSIYIQQSGPSLVKFISVNGDITIKNEGAGEINIEKSNSKKINIHNFGAGSIFLKTASAKEASLNVYGSGNIKINVKKIDNIIQKKSGCGNIYIQ